MEKLSNINKRLNTSKKAIIYLTKKQIIKYKQNFVSMNTELDSTKPDFDNMKQIFWICSTR
jgi:hypothetical protein